MKAAELRTYLLGERDELGTVAWLRGEFLPLVVAGLSMPDARRRLGIYDGEKIPENERNLTDVRNRVSLIIEYEAGRLVTKMLDRAGLKDMFISYVVANRFPDLEVRTAVGRRGLRVEVKCLQSLAEEKSANFDTLKKDIHPLTDYVLVFLWEWRYDGADIAWDRAPEILKVFCFNALALAQLRDWYWLNQPPNGLGSGLQGFDLRYAVNCTRGRYNQEEGNYGKLLRIWTAGFPYAPNWTPVLKQTEADYLAFKTEVVRAGFDTLAAAHLSRYAGGEPMTPVVRGREQLGWYAGGSAFLMGACIAGQKRQQLFKSLGLGRVVVFSDKYAWREFEVDAEGRASELASGSKPKHFIRMLTSGHQPRVRGGVKAPGQV